MGYVHGDLEGSSRILPVLNSAEDDNTMSKALLTCNEEYDSCSI